jgi:hypothetical protein
MFDSEKLADDEDRVGHKVTTIVKLKNKIAGKDDKKNAACKLKWFEKTKIPADPHVPKDKWYDANDYAKYLENPEKKFNDKLPTDCPSETKTFTFVDKPGLIKPFKKGTTALQWLCIRVVITDGCSGSETIKTFEQEVYIFKGDVISVTPPKTREVVQEYCKYP